jgi:hypothetical protein
MKVSMLDEATVAFRISLILALGFAQLFHGSGDATAPFSGAAKLQRS